MLSELAGHDGCDAAASPLAVTATFRVLSDAGLAAVSREIAAQQMAGFEQSSVRIPRVLRGGAMRSPLLAGLLS